MVDISKVINQVEILLIEHANCDKHCSLIGLTNVYDHRKAVAGMIGYYVLGLSNG
jgi:hypothetical protein